MQFIRHFLFAVFSLFILYGCNSPQANTTHLTFSGAASQENSAAAKSDTQSLERSFPKLNVPVFAEKIDAYFQKKHKEDRFNGAVLVSRYGQVLYKNAFGYSNFRNHDSLAINSSFQLASVSKQFTAVAVLMLMEKKKLSLEDSIQRFFPDFPYHGITVRNLLNHRSGLCNYAYFCDRFYRKHEGPYSNMDVIRLMTEHQPKSYLPVNTRFDYSNTGYVILAAIVEKASGMSFPDYVRKNIFLPLGMKHSYVGRADSSTEVMGYNHPGRVVVKDYLDEIYGDKGIYASVEDLYIWDRALYTEKLLKQKTLAEAFTGASPEQKGPFDYGFGWRIYTASDSSKIVFHAGWWKGFKTFFMRRLKDETCVIILSNVANRSYKDIDELMDIVYERQRGPESKFYQKILHSPE